jgi:hypothetical protein
MNWPSCEGYRGTPRGADASQRPAPAGARCRSIGRSSTFKDGAAAIRNATEQAESGIFYWLWTGRDSVARQRDGATVSPVAWGQARSISDDMRMMAARPVGVKWDGGVGGVWL